MAVLRSKKNNGPQQDYTVPSLYRLARESGLCCSPIDLAGLAKLLGVKIIRTRLNETISGILKRDPAGVWTILCNINQSRARTRFTIAHELGHFCCHREPGLDFEDDVFFRSDVSDRKESEANRFAGELLMPAEDFHAAVRAGVHDIDALAKRFDVSTYAVRVRAKELNYQGHGL